MSEPMLRAIHSGVIKLGDIELPCYVLNNEKRVLAQRAVVALISGGRESGNLTRYLEAKNIQSLLPDNLRKGRYDDHILKFLAGSNITHGLEAGDVIDICKTYLKSRQNGTLHPSQAKNAEHAEIFVQASAKTGIDAVVDEATGYEYFRRANDLQERLSAYLQEEYRDWTLTFKKDFFLQLYKLEGRKPPMPLKKYPKRFGRYIMRFVYDTLDPEIADWLREHNPNPEGQKHHWQKFNDFGYDRLQGHLMSVMGIMKASPTLERFKEGLSIAFPNARTQRMARLSENKRKQKESLGQQSMFEVL